MTVEVPSDSVRTRRVAIAAVVAVCIAVLLGLGVWAWTRPPRVEPGQTAIEPAEQTEPATTSPAAEPGSTSPTYVPQQATEPTAQAPAPSVGVDAHKIAFVLDGSIYISAQDGSGPVAVAPQGGMYSLSPDARTLAVVYGASSAQGSTVGSVSLFDTATGAMRSAGTDATLLAPDWAPDSQWLAYSSNPGTPRIIRLDADGGNAKRLASPAALPRISRDGGYVAFSTSEVLMADDLLRVLPSAGGKAVSVSGGVGAMSWDWGPSDTLYFTRPGAEEGSWELWRATAPAFKGRRVASVSLEAPAYALDDLTVSVDGSHCAMGATGDDAYSRLWVATTKSGRFSTIATRRDAYPIQWTEEGRLLYFEGNAYQGQSSSLVRVSADGTGKRVVVAGAQR